MRRLLQFGTMLLMLVAVVSPLLEFFDRWDPPGVSNDTEFAVFAVVLALGLVLIVCKLVSALALLVRLVLLGELVPADDLRVEDGGRRSCFFVPALSPPPLRI